MQLLHFVLNRRQQISAMLFRFVMVVVSFEVEQVSLKLMLCFLNLLLLASEVLIFIKLFELITLPITSCMIAVLLPVAKTDPTIFIFAQTASHMNATLIFLNLSLTRWTSFRVCKNPLNIWAFSGILFPPLLSTFAVCRLMRIQTTWEAKRSSAIALHIRGIGVNVFLIEKLATFPWAAFNKLVFVCVRSAKLNPVFLKHIWVNRKESFEDTVANLNVAPRLHAPGF